MTDYKEIFSTIFIIFITCVLCALTIISIVQGQYAILKKVDKAAGTVYCNNQEVYKGRLYVVTKTLVTENLQAPMFDVIIKNADNAFIIEKHLFCRDLQINK